MIILKFGGTSLRDIAMIKKSADIIIRTRKKYKVLVVVSAMSGVTNILLELCDAAGKGNMKKVTQVIQLLTDKHIEIAKNLCNGSCDIKFMNKIDQYSGELSDILRGIALLRQISPRGKAKVLYFGEILASLLLSLAVDKSGMSSNMYKSKDLLYCSGDFMDGECDYKISEKRLKYFKKMVNLDKEIPVITGFGGGDDIGNIYLFDRGGSDYVASIIGSLMKVKRIEIWTDVDGIYSADPKLVDDAILWKKLDYSVAAEFAIVGAKVLHTKTISPAQEKKIPLIIKNTFDRQSNGTQVCKMKDEGVKGISIDDKQVIFTFIDPSMICASGYISDVIEVFKKNKVSVDCIATTETSFSISIKKKCFSKELIKGFDHLREHFDLEINEKVSKISIVGDTIDNYSILNELKNVIMVSAGAYGKSLTIFIKTINSKKLLTSLHKEIFNS